MNNPLMSLIQPKPGVAQSNSTFRFVAATVTAAYPDPVQVQVDTETEPLGGVPSMLCTVGLGDRVLLLQWGRRVWVLGVAQPDQSGSVDVQRGIVNITPTAVNTRTTYHVTFDVEFASVPTVFVSPYTSVPDKVFVSYTNPSTTGVDIVLLRSDVAVLTSVSWQAIRI